MPPEQQNPSGPILEASPVADSREADESIENVPDGGYGWVQVGVAFTINCFTWGQTASFGVYLAHYLSSGTFKTATPLDYALVGGLQFSMSMLVGPLVTITVRKFGTQIPMLIGIAIQSAGFIAASYSTRIQDVYISQGLVLGIGLGFIFVPSTPILAQWFSTKRSLAVGISSAGSGIGGILFSFISQAMIDNISLAWAFRITAAIVGSMNLTAAALIRNRNRIVLPTQRGFDTKILFRYDVFLFLAWGFASMLSYIAVLYSLPDFALSINLSTSRAAAISAFLNLGTAVGRPIIGLLSDRLGRIEVAGVLTLCSGLACFALWLPATNYAVTILFALANGCVVGVFWMTVAPVAVEVVGLAHVPSLLSWMWLTIVPPTLVSELIALKLRRSSGMNKYLYVQIYAGLSCVVASMCLFELWRVRQRAVSKPESSRTVQSEDTTEEK